MTKVYLSLGSNIDNRLSYLEEALESLGTLPQTSLVAVSSIYETKAWGKTDQADFLNLACQLETSLSALALLEACQKIEKALGRVRHSHWGPRTIDIDILLYGEEIIKTSDLQVPHPYMCQRAFVVIPLLDIVSDLKLPTGQELSQCLAQLEVEDVHIYRKKEEKK
ncbi:2-amino-4-hydroxy-6-hydroxymethyldihydropteridine diphosphokinase [Streptococcus sp. zg-JUN1979]|uniref:2-amino-4-hydroxy-6- hydroxymethyldihydropteridine diphosphokinase n=1 Tax=Streptococcus sp. zg-JUN1979 TaxID=3391450 RepID=UPI0039A72AF3